MYGGMGLSGMQQPMTGGSGGGYQAQLPGGGGGQRGGGSMYGGIGMPGQPQFAYQYGQQGAPGGAEGQARRRERCEHAEDERAPARSHLHHASSQSTALSISP